MSNKMAATLNLVRYVTSEQAYRIDFLMNKQRERKIQEHAKYIERLRWYVLRHQEKKRAIIGSPMAQNDSNRHGGDYLF